jgi:putative CocE/NonD family hydrolase
MRSQTEMMPMRDGIQLAASVYLPNTGSAFPVILERTPYGRDKLRPHEITQHDRQPWDGPALARYFTEHGYAVVLQDCRGRYGSQGAFVKYTDDAEDGFDSCAWIRQQTWCDGRLATIGMSYGAHVQAALASLDPPGLEVQILDSGGFSNAWRSSVRQNGAFELKQASWAFREAARSPEAAADPLMKAALESEDLADWLTRMPWKPSHSPLRFHPRYEAALFEQWRNGAFSEFWAKPGLCAEQFYDRYSRAACLHMSSWFDPYSTTASENYIGLRQNQRGPQRLILGPWTHGNRSDTVFGDVDFGAAATLDSWAGDWRQARLRFLNSVFKGITTDESPVMVFVMGGGAGGKTASGHLNHGGRWISATDWPMPETRMIPYYLTGAGGLETTPPATAAPPVSYDFDPSHPVPTIGGNFSSFDPILHWGSYDQTETANVFGCSKPYLPLASRADVLVCQTEALSTPCQLVGAIMLDLWVSTDGPDTDFTAKLIDVHPPSESYPQGYAMLLGDCIFRLRYVEDPAIERLRTPGEIVRIEKVGFYTANLFATGHRIRIDISSSNFPKFDVNPNTGEPDGAAHRRRKAINTIFVDNERPSCVHLPILPIVEDPVP